MSERINNFLGDTPGKTLVRLLIISCVVGIVMSTLGLTPMELWYKLQDFVVRLYNLGFDAIWRIAKYFVWGAVVVVPIFLLSRLLKCADPCMAGLQINTSGKSTSSDFEVTHRMVLSIAIPMTFGYLTTPLLGLVDTGVIGQLGVPALIGGLAVGTILVDIIFFTFNFLRSGTVGLTAQAYGAGDEKEIQATLIRALGIALIIGLVLIILSPAMLSLGLWAMEPSEAAARATKEYYQIRILSAPFALANYALFGWFVGHGKTKTALILQVMLNGINIVLSIFLGLYMQWGISGVATATVIGEVLACVAGMIIAWKMVNPDHTPDWAEIKNAAAIKKLVAMNGDIMIRSFALLFSFGYFTAQSAKFGDAILAANTVLMHFFLLVDTSLMV